MIREKNEFKCECETSSTSALSGYIYFLVREELKAM